MLLYSMPGRFLRYEIEMYYYLLEGRHGEFGNVIRLRPLQETFLLKYWTLVEEVIFSALPVSTSPDVAPS